MIKTALSRKRTRANYFLYLSLWIHSWRRRTIWWEGGWWFPLSLAVRIRRWWFKILTILLTISGTKRPALCYDYFNFWAEATKRTRERRTTFAREKERDTKKNTRSRYVLLSFSLARSFPTMMLKDQFALMFKMIKSTLFTESESRANENRSNNEATEHRPR